MTKQICTTCGCFFEGEGFEKDGKAYCCEPCAEDGQCECGCCEIAKEK
jgi:hypothetical protein